MQEAEPRAGDGGRGRENVVVCGVTNFASEAAERYYLGRALEN